jgi:hypothetical protein
MSADGSRGVTAELDAFHHPYAYGYRDGGDYVVN